MQIYAVIFIFVYPVGIPAMYFALLYRKRHAIDPTIPRTKKKARMTVNSDDVKTALAIRLQNHHLQPLAFLFESYEPAFWWWECLVCFQRLLLTSSHIYLSSNELLQPFIVLMVALVSVKLYSALDPYILDSDDMFAEISQWFITATIIMTLIFQAHAASASSGIGILMNTMMMFVVGILAYYCLKTLKTEVSFFAKMFPRTTKAGTVLMASTKRLLLSSFESPTEDTYHQGVGFEMAPNEPDNTVKTELQIGHVDLIEKEPRNLVDGSDSLVFEL